MRRRPNAPASSAKAVILGHLVGGAVAIGVNQVLDKGDPMAPGVAVALAITGMKLFDCVHPPAAACAADPRPCRAASAAPRSTARGLVGPRASHLALCSVARQLRLLRGRPGLHPPQERCAASLALRALPQTRSVVTVGSRVAMRAPVLFPGLLGAVVLVAVQKVYLAIVGDGKPKAKAA